MFASSPDLSPDYMVAVTSAGVPMQFGADLEKENDHLPPSRKSGKKQQSANPAGAEPVVIRRPLLGIASEGQGGLAKPAAPLHKLQKTPSPDMLTPKGICKPMLSPYLKELSSPSPGSSQASPLRSIKKRGTQGQVRSARTVRAVAAASPERFDTPLVSDVQGKVKSAQPILPMCPKSGIRAVVRVRARRALTLQSGEKRRTLPEDLGPSRRNACSKSVGHLNLSAACLQSAARANLSRSADWPASSAACIRKRMEEGSGYEVPRKSLKHEDQKSSWCPAAVRLARMSLQDQDHVSFGNATSPGYEPVV